MVRHAKNGWSTDGVLDGHVTCTRSGHILHCDRPFAEMLGYSGADALMHAVASLGDLFADRLPGAWQPLVWMPEESVGEFRCIRRDGTSIWVELRAEGDLRGAELDFRTRDVTSREHLEAQLQEARRRDLTGRISAGMTRDIDDLISAILAQVDLAEGSLQIRDIVGVDRDLEELRLTAHRGSRMVRQMLSFNHGEALELRTVALSDVVGAAARLIRPLLPESMVFRVVEEAAPPVRADAAAIEQILIKLALYARDAMGEGGRLTLRVGSTRVTPPECRRRGWGVPGEYGSISICDTGVGLPDGTVEQLFEPFFQGESGDARAPGMVVVYALMKQHRGFVEVVNRSGVGPGLDSGGTQVRLLFRPAAASGLRVTSSRYGDIQSA